MYRPRAKRTLGMTRPQWLVLIFLLLCLCVTLGVGYYWLNWTTTRATSGAGGFLPDFTPPPTQTPPATETSLPTETVTPITYQSLIPEGWKKFRAVSLNNLDIWLPNTYVIMNDNDKKKAIPILGSAEDDPNLKVMLELKDKTPSSYLIFTTFGMWAQADPGGDLDALIDQRLGGLMRSGRLMERGKFEFRVRDYDARRLLFDINVGSVNAGLAMYVVRTRGEVYFLGYATVFNELFNRLQAFDDSIQTFHSSQIVPTKTPTLTPAPPTNTPLP